MVFSSVTAYLDSPNWQPQQINHHHQITGASSTATNPLLPPPPPPQQPQHGRPGAGPIRPGSMSERARMANIPMPESALKCPRCESTNTKFCYFNNYSLSQPRHFCKTCRRYWTRGGALRSVPVGGGCRRNKRSNKSATSSKSSPASSDNNNNRQINNSYAGGLVNLTPPQFMSPLGQLSESFAGDMGLMSGNMNISGDNNSLIGFEQWKLQQFPFVGGLDGTTAGIGYQFHGGGESGFLSGGGGEVRPKISSSFLSQLKMEGNNRNPELSLVSGQLLGGMQENEHDQWSVNGGGGDGVNWTELSSFSSSSTSNHLQ